MAVIGHSIKSFNAVRKNLMVKKIDINSTPTIIGVKEKPMGLAGIKEKIVALGIDFEFDTEYKPGVGSIKIAGEVIYNGKDNKKTLAEWKKNKKLPSEADIEVKNFLLKKCLLMGVIISQEMQLPPPLVIPIIREKKEQRNYIG